MKSNPNGEDLLPRHYLRRLRQFHADHEEVLAIILYGSRAKGLSNPNSDYDLCCILEEGVPKDLSFPHLDDEYSPDEWWVVHEKRFLRKRLERGSLASAVATQGLCVAGSNEYVNLANHEVIHMDTEATLTSFGNSVNHLVFCFILIKRLRSHFLAEDFPSLSKQSAEAAEHLIKGYMWLVGLIPQHSHDIDKLAAEIIRLRPTDKLAADLRRLNGSASLDRLSEYPDEPTRPEIFGSSALSVEN